MRGTVMTAMAVVLMASPAMAAGNAAAGLQAMKELNLIVLGNVTGGHDVEGKTFIGGDLSGNSMTVGIGNATQGAAASGRATLTVGGALSASGVNVNNGSNGGFGSVASNPGVVVVGNAANFNLNAAGSTVRIGGNAQQVKANGGGSVFVDGSINTLEIGGGGTAQVGGGVTTLKAGSNTNVQVGGSVGGLDMQGAGAVVGVGANTNNFNGASGGILKTNTKSGYANANGATVTSGLGLGWNAGDLTGLNQTSGVAAETAQLGLDLAALSQTFAGLTVATNHSTANFLSNKLTLNAVGEPEGFALFNLDASKLTGTDLAYNFAPGDYSVIINVTGLSAVNSVLNWNMNPAAGGSAFNQRIIWNFADAAGTVHFNRMVNGSVLAPFATVSNTTPIEGSVAVKAFNMGGEIHLGTFAGNPIPSAVPEPSSWAMMLAGVGALGATLRRRRRTQPAMAAA